jgi:hypothetical protein
MKRLLISLIFMAAVAGAATIDLSLTSSLVYTQSAGPVQFSGTITNTGPGPAFINGDTVTSQLPFDDTSFLLNVPPVLGPGATFTGPLFAILVSPSLPVGLYTGTFDVLGGDGPNATDVLGSTTFGVQVVPEPGTWMAGFGLVAVMLSRKLRRD